MHYVKRGSAPHSAAAEAAGLRWLREGSVAVVEVYGVNDAANTLSIERVGSTRPTSGLARAAGRELARIHAAGAPAFGAPPSGWDGPNFIGRIEQECTPTRRWADFYVHQRVLPFADMARSAGNLSRAGWGAVKRACDALLAEDEDAPLARIHGDLWAGNLLFSPQGPRFIDPAAHGGHPLTDIAMLELFGVPLFEDIVAGYAETGELSTGWRERIPIHQLHPLAVHALTHGPSYGDALVRVASRLA
ncbi:Fructosamine kinase [Corynebacterium capitovis DSM 44611]|uniref:fructosamine kinase family protein n=1 Tax=Corynebacterium capitovis TaxID=131081 RepID=UPI000361E0A1|nr:fructosamine kinase family protein [Corynebacterium capitovis]WKD57102.1 Fructosamine kinase [Corynebacterium capitovis DSM 44611]